MEIIKDDLYPDIYSLYLYFLDKGSTSGLTRKDFKVLKQLEHDISYDLVMTNHNWYTLYNKIESLISFMYAYGLANKYSEETILYLKTEAPLLPLVLANSRGKYKTDFVKMYSDDSFMFKCQFHNENTPSMGVTNSKNLFYCFGCGFSGNNIDYLVECENLSYREAVKLLGEIYLIDLKDKKAQTEQEHKLITKYQNAILNNDYLELLKRLEARLNIRGKGTISLQNASEHLVSQYAQIERIKNGEYDPNFLYKKPIQKVYLDRGDNYV